MTSTPGVCSVSHSPLSPTVWHFTFFPSGAGVDAFPLSDGFKYAGRVSLAVSRFASRLLPRSLVGCGGG